MPSDLPSSTSHERERRHLLVRIVSSPTLENYGKLVTPGAISLTIYLRLASEISYYEPWALSLDALCLAPTFAGKFRGSTYFVELLIVSRQFCFVKLVRSYKDQQFSNGRYLQWCYSLHVRNNPTF